MIRISRGRDVVLDWSFLSSTIVTVRRLNIVYWRSVPFIQLLDPVPTERTRQMASRLTNNSVLFGHRNPNVIIRCISSLSPSTRSDGSEGQELSYSIMSISKLFYHNTYRYCRRWKMTLQSHHKYSWSWMITEVVTTGLSKPWLWATEGP